MHQFEGTLALPSDIGITKIGSKNPLLRRPTRMTPNTPDRITVRKGTEVGYKSRKNNGHWIDHKLTYANKFAIYRVLLSHEKPTYDLDIWIKETTDTDRWITKMAEAYY